MALDRLAIEKALNWFSLVVGFIIIFLSLFDIFIHLTVQAFSYFFALLLGWVYVFNESWEISFIRNELIFLRHWIGRAIFVIFIGFVLLTTENVSIAFSVLLLVAGLFMVIFQFLRVPVPPPLRSNKLIGTGTATGTQTQTGTATAPDTASEATFRYRNPPYGEPSYGGDLNQQQPLIPPPQQQQQQGISPQQPQTSFNIHFMPTAPPPPNYSL